MKWRREEGRKRKEKKKEEEDKKEEKKEEKDEEKRNERVRFRESRRLLGRNKRVTWLTSASLRERGGSHALSRRTSGGSA